MVVVTNLSCFIDVSVFITNIGHSAYSRKSLSLKRSKSNLCHLNLVCHIVSVILEEL